MKTLFALGLLLLGASLAADAESGASISKIYTYKHSAGKPRVMEIHFPPNNDPTKAKVPGVILFHGGGWTGGRLELHRKQCAYFASRGLVCATAEYELLDKASIAKLPKGESLKMKMKHGTNKAVISYPGYNNVVLEF